MNGSIDIFVELGRRLESFGKDSLSQRVIQAAMEENDWFRHDDIILAVKAIREEFLNREKLISWTAAYKKCESQKVLIIMAGNIPLVGFFDLMCVLMAGHTALVKPSSKDKVMTEYIIKLLQDICTTIPIEAYVGEQEFDMVIATGGDQAAKYFRDKYNNLPTIIRGSRHSLAVLDGNESKSDIEALCEDIISYNGLGCRNVSLLMINKELPMPFPLCTPSDMHRQNYAHTKAMRTILGQRFIDYGCYIFVKEDSFPESISQINIIQYDTIEQVEEWLKSNDEKIQCIVSNIINHPRRVAFGRAQYPTLWDYADGVDVMKFLTEE